MIYRNKMYAGLWGAALLNALVCMALIAGCTSPDGPSGEESFVSPVWNGDDAPTPGTLTGTDATSLQEIVQRARERKKASEKVQAGDPAAVPDTGDTAAEDVDRLRELFAQEYQTYVQLKQLYDSGFVTQEELSRAWQDLCRRWNVRGAGQEPAWLLWNPGTGLVESADSASPRFIDNRNGSVTDMRTGLVWLQNALAAGEMSWHDAVSFCAGLAGGMLGLTDGSAAGQWRLPGIADLQSLGTDPPESWNEGRPPVTWNMPGTPFVNVRSLNYRAATTAAHDGDYAGYISMRNGFTRYNLKSRSYFVWPVRGGEG